VVAADRSGRPAPTMHPAAVLPARIPASRAGVCPAPAGGTVVRLTVPPAGRSGPAGRDDE